MKVVGIIPSRLQSTRLTNKALIDICGLPMIVHVFKRAEMSSILDDVFVATDSTEIRDVVKQNNGNVLMTSGKHCTGTDRIAEAARLIEADIIVNIQGDEPLLNPSHIEKVVEPLLHDSNINIAALITPYKKKNSTSDIKAVVDLNYDILYCSRSDLPSDARKRADAMWKMCFIIPFKKEFLFEYSSWSQTPLEKIEFNEYLRVLEHGYKIKAVPVENAHISVDTTQDLKLVKKLMSIDNIKKSYMG